VLLWVGETKLPHCSTKKDRKCGPKCAAWTACGLILSTLYYTIYYKGYFYQKHDTPYRDFLILQICLLIYIWWLYSYNPYIHICFSSANQKNSFITRINKINGGRKKITRMICNIDLIISSIIKWDTPYVAESCEAANPFMRCPILSWRIQKMPPSYLIYSNKWVGVSSRGCIKCNKNQVVDNKQNSFISLR